MLAYGRKFYLALEIQMPGLACAFSLDIFGVVKILGFCSHVDAAM